MARRQTDTKIWTTQRWFKKLLPEHKLVWKYLTDMCDHAGIWKVDFGQLVEDTGLEDFNLTCFIEACNSDFDKENGEKISRERIKLINKSTLWITGFIKFQYEGKDFLVNPKVAAIKSALVILRGHGVLQEGIDKGYYTLSEPLDNPFKPLKKPSETVIDRDKDSDRDKDCIPEGRVEDELGGLGEKEGEEKGGLPLQMLVPQMQQVWAKTFPHYTTDKERDYEALRSIAIFVFKNAGIVNGFGDTNLEIKALNTFQLIADQVNREQFWVNKPLSSISKNIQEFYNKIKNPVHGQDKQTNGRKSTIDEAVLKQKLADKIAGRKQASG